LNNTVEKRERLFFLAMATAIAVVVIAGFGLFLRAGFSSFVAPIEVHIHAVTYMGWVFLYFFQNWLIFSNNAALHRKLGMIGAGYLVWVILVGLVTTYLSVISGHTPPIFTPASLFALNLMLVVTFAILAIAALTMRKKTDWHRRLMLCATIAVIAPAFGRLLILVEARTHFNFVMVILVWATVPVLYDLVAYRKIHAAYLWGVGALVGMGLAIELLPSFQPFAELAQHLAN